MMVKSKALQQRSKGFTLIELLVVIAIIAILIALLVPAVQKVREAAARTQSINNLKQLGLAFHNFHDSTHALPFNGAAGSVAVNGNNQTGSWAFQILPYIEQNSLFLNTFTLGQANFGLPAFVCQGRGRPTGSATGAWTDYGINTWINDASAGSYSAGNVKRTMVGLTDGTSNTIFVGHMSIDTPYVSGVTTQSGLINTGGTSGTARGVVADGGLINQSDKTTTAGSTNKLSWGSSFFQGGLMGLGDGTVRMFPYTSHGILTVFLTPAAGDSGTLPD